MASHPTRHANKHRIHRQVDKSSGGHVQIKRGIRQLDDTIENRVEAGDSPRHDLPGSY